MRRLLLFVSLLFCCVVYSAPRQMRIWDGTNVRAKGVTLTPYMPDGVKPRAAVIVCPGGSYFWLDVETEGKGVAEWLRENGIAAFVLEYRTGGVPSFVTHIRGKRKGHQHPAMIQDIQRSIQIVRDSAEAWGIDAERIGTIGFSAGGHLSLSSAEYFKTDFLRLVGVETRVSLRPDFSAALYPVVTFSEKCTHERSCRGLLGQRKRRGKVMRDSMSLERHVHKDMPPLFIVNCKDDPIVHWKNSVLMDSALTAVGVEHKYIMYQTGGHGFGADEKKATAECIEWKKEFLIWIKSLYGDE